MFNEKDLLNNVKNKAINNLQAKLTSIQNAPSMDVLIQDYAEFLPCPSSCYLVDSSEDCIGDCKTCWENIYNQRYDTSL